MNGLYGGLTGGLGMSAGPWDKYAGTEQREASAFSQEMMRQQIEAQRQYMTYGLGNASRMQQELPKAEAKPKKQGRPIEQVQAEVDEWLKDVA